MIRFQFVDFSLVWKTNNPENLLKLIHGRLSLKKGSPENKLGNHTTNTPNVNCLIAWGKTQKNLWRTIPSRSHIFSDYILICLLRILLLHSTKTKVTKFYITICVNQDIRWFNISMNKITFMKVWHCLKYLICNIFPLYGLHYTSS